jgi:hypothetical protein
MKKRIEIDFEDEITNDLVLDVIERAMRQAVEAVAECAKIRKVTVDGNVFWLPDPLDKDEKGPAKKEAKREYPLHHETPVVHRVPGLWK